MTCALFRKRRDYLRPTSAHCRRVAATVVLTVEPLSAPAFERPHSTRATEVWDVSDRVAAPIPGGDRQPTPPESADSFRAADATRVDELLGPKHTVGATRHIPTIDDETTGLSRAPIPYLLGVDLLVAQRENFLGTTGSGSCCEP